MKKSSIIVISAVIILVVIAIMLFWPRSPKFTIGSIQLSGAVGVEFTGYYIQDRQRVPVSGVLPWSLHTRITEFEFRKVHPDDTLTVTVRYGKVGKQEAINETKVGAGDLGVSGRVQPDGLATSTFTQ